MTLLTLERKLRSGETPKTLGLKSLGNGVQKTAYLVKCDVRDYVVKENTGAFRLLDAKGNAKKICPNLQKYGIIRVIQKQVGNWLIQEYTEQLGSLDIKHPHYNTAWETYNNFDRNRREDKSIPRGDFHAWNFGVTKSGRLVCFDW